MSKTILVIDDDIELCNLLRQCLGNEGFEVHCLHDGKQTLPFLKKSPVDLIILDVMLPEIDGFTILRQIRAISEIPVLMLSARNDEMNKVLGLRTGADDYITKPFGLSELIARVENLLRRCGVSRQREHENRPLICGDLVIDRETCIVTIRNEVIPLTSKEYKLLCFFAENPQKVFTRKQIYGSVWDDDYLYDDNTIMALVSRLRKKIERNPDEPTYVLTVRGLGYRFSGEVK